MPTGRHERLTIRQHDAIKHIRALALRLVSSGHNLFAGGRINRVHMKRTANLVDATMPFRYRIVNPLSSGEAAVSTQEQSLSRRM